MDVRIQEEGVTVGVGSAASGTISVDARVHPVTAITRSCYALADIATFEVRSDDTAIVVRVSSISGLPIETIIEHFRTSLVDFTLREDIEARTKGMRDLIWQTAFGEVQKRAGP